jgi:hypothetical protein
MESVYNLLRETCGISQTEAADVHSTRLDTVKSWCSGRRPVPSGVIDQLGEIARDIHQAATEFAGKLKRGTEKSGSNTFTIGLPKDETDARWCGFPCLGAHLRTIGLTIAQLPPDAEILLADRGSGMIPTPTLKKKPAPAIADYPDPAPGGFQSQVNAGMRRPRPR